MTGRSSANPADSRILTIESVSASIKLEAGESLRRILQGEIERIGSGQRSDRLVLVAQENAGLGAAASGAVRETRVPLAFLTKRMKGRNGCEG